MQLIYKKTKHSQDRHKRGGWFYTEASLRKGYLHFSKTPLASTEALKLFQCSEMLYFTSMAAKRKNTTAAS